MGLIEENFEALNAIVTHSVQGVSQYWKEDCAQEAWIAIIKKVPLWKPELGSFSTFCSRRAHGAVIDYLRQQLGRDGRGLKFSDSDFDPGMYDSYNIHDREEVDQTMKRLTKKEQLICTYLSYGYTKTEIALEFGVSESRISHLVLRIPDRLGPRKNL